MISLQARCRTAVDDSDRAVSSDESCDRAVSSDDRTAENCCAELET